MDRIIDHALKRSRPEYVVTPNAHHIVLLQKDPFFLRIYQNALLIVPDGVSLLKASDFLNTPFRERVNGTDLFERLCEAAKDRGLKVFFLGGRPGAVEKCKQVLLKRYPNLEIAGVFCPSYNIDKDKQESLRIREYIKKAQPHILFVGLGTPKQEKWIYKNYQDLEVPISIGIGISFELVSDMIKRAPVWAQRASLEWFFRLMAEPQRLLLRYMEVVPGFIWLVLCQWWRKKFLFKSY